MTATEPATRTFFASCAKSLEPLLEQELDQLGARELRQTVAGVFFSAPLITGYRASLFSRLASRVVALVAEGPAGDAGELYHCAASVDWTQHMHAEQTISVRAAGVTAGLRHTRFIAQKVKDAVVDGFRDRGLPRPDVARDDPDLLLHAVIKKGRLSLGIDLSGQSLHQRGYRREKGVAPLRETLAAAALVRAGWPELMRTDSALLHDPLCGSGTFLIEGLLMALDIAPGLASGQQCSGWLQHDAQLFGQVLEEARQRRRDTSDWTGRALGSDVDPEVVQKARRNAERAGVYDHLELHTASLEDSLLPAETGLIIANPPYAERLGDEPQTMALYEQLGRFLQRQPEGSRAAVLTARPQWGHLLGLRSHKQYAFFNGSLPTRLLLFDLGPDNRHRGNRPADGEPSGNDSDTRAPAELDQGARMLANRLRKNLRNLGRWARRQEQECYRLYDADMPEYAFAIDLYGRQVHMQEYQAPASIREADAELRRQQAIQAVMHALDVDASQIALKMRRRQRGRQQYEAGEHKGEAFTVREGPARFLVNLRRYLDTGLFLDHRPVRRLLREQAAGRRFLNLFCYTGTATVHAALGGATDSLSVDMSRSYLDWASENFALNGLDPDRHRLLRRDCMAWLAEDGESFDLIFLDAPTFSNSSNTDNVLDIQRDHRQLIEQCMRRLTPGGLLVFSTNRRRFRLEEEIGQRFEVEDYSARSLDRDFARNNAIHQVWLIRHCRAAAD